MVGMSNLNKSSVENLQFKFNAEFIVSHLFSGTGKRLTRQQFHCFHLHDRVVGTNDLLKCERLFQEYLCVSSAPVENIRLQYVKHNQDVLRSDLYANLQDAVRSSDNSRVRVGKRIICPKSIFNSFRNRFARYYSTVLSICLF